MLAIRLLTSLAKPTRAFWAIAFRFLWAVFVRALTDEVERQVAIQVSACSRAD
jgi:hypothetical protein